MGEGKADEQHAAIKKHKQGSLAQGVGGATQRHGKQEGVRGNAKAGKSRVEEEGNVNHEWA